MVRWGGGQPDVLEVLAGVHTPGNGGLPEPSGPSTPKAAGAPVGSGAPATASNW